MVYRNENELGPVLFACRPLPFHMQGVKVRDNWSRLTRLQAWLFRYVMVFLVALPGGSLMLAVLLFAASDLVLTLTQGSKSSFLVALVAWPCIYLIFALLTFFWPRTRYLHAHDRGVAGKWPWQRFAVQFDDIAYLQIGSKPSSVDAILKVTSTVDLVARDTLALREYARKNAIALVLRDGRTISLGFLFAAFEDSDAARLVEFLSMNVPAKIAGSAD